MHGYNTRFEEAVYRFAQIAHDAGAPVVPVLFTWPSRGKLFDYVYDRESATYSRDGLEAVLEAMAQGFVCRLDFDSRAFDGQFRRGRSVAANGDPQSLSLVKIRDIMLAAPDIDVDVFRREIAEIEASDKSPPITLFISQDDHALDFSRRLAGNEPRLGAIDPNAEPYRTILEKAHVNVIDLTRFNADDLLNHGKFSAQSDVVKTIGSRLAAGQTPTDAKQTLGERFGGVAMGAAETVGKAATLAVSAPASIVDPGTRETLGEQAASFGVTAADAVRSPVSAVAQ